MKNLNEFGKILSGRNYNKKNRLPQMADSLQKNVSSVRSRQLEVGQVVYKVETILEDLFNKEILEEIHIQSYKNNKLYLTTPNSLIAQELKFVKDDILNKLKEKFAVKEVVILIKDHQEIKYN